MSNSNQIDQLRMAFRGDLILAGDDSYDQMRKVFNGMIDRHPFAIARCKDVVDVINTVNFARNNNLLVSIRGGGHNVGGLGVCDDGIVIDLSNIKYTHVDPAAKTVRVGGGTTWGDVDHATNLFGFAVPGGTVSTTGVSGLTVGGGVGHLSRKYGLSIDNLIEAEIVLANGKFVKASAAKNKDLFWAIRGGGGNFGVITSFQFKLNKVKNVYGGPMFWEIDRAPEIMRWYDLYIRKAPTDITGFFAFLSVPPIDPFPEHLRSKTMCAIVWCYIGDEKKAVKIFKPIRQLKPAFEMVRTIPFPVLQTFFDPLLKPGINMYWKGDFINELPDELIALYIKHAKLKPTLLSQTHFYPVNGKAGKPKKKDTAWSFRDTTYSMVIIGMDYDPVNNEAITKWAKDFFNDIHPYSSGGAYINFMMHDEGDDRIKSTYRDNYDRLARIKKKYDPKNLFRVNHNINPAGKKKVA